MKMGTINMAGQGYNRPSLTLPDDIDPEVRAELEEAGTDLSIRVKQCDGMITGDFNYCRNNVGKDGQSDYRNFMKTFPNWKEFTTFADKFFAIGEPKDETKE